MSELKRIDTISFWYYELFLIFRSQTLLSLLSSFLFLPKQTFLYLSSSNCIVTI